MRFILAVLAATVGTAIAKSHHHHRHAHVHAKRDTSIEEVSVTVVECWLEGHQISEAACREGIENGTLRWADNGGTVELAKPVTRPVAIDPKPLPVPKPEPAPTVQMPEPPPPAPLVEKPAPLPAAPPPAPAPAPAPAPIPAPLPAPSPEPAPVLPKPATVAPENHDESELHGAQTPFPDGKLDCSEFPSDFGAVRTPWLGLGGWASVQKPQCEDGNCCIEGSYCSYACGEGLLKWQWPSTQGAEGQSVGGLLCENGKLHLTNPSVPTLCAPGNDQVKVVVKNELPENVVICRTNYPGDEKMSIGVDVTPQKSKKLACPDGRKYWKTNTGQPTSAQYYINIPGVPMWKACDWGQPGDDTGNFAPANLGVGIVDGVAYISIFRNYPTQQTAVLPYTVTIKGGSIPCRYQNGQICRGEGYSICESQGNAGCTVAASSGTVTFILSK